MPEVQSTYSMVRDAWKDLKKSEIYGLQKERMIAWRSGSSIERVERPTRLDRARALGYKAKGGFIVVRARVRRGGRNKPKIMGPFVSYFNQKINDAETFYVSGTIRKCRKVISRIPAESSQPGEKSAFLENR